MPRTDMQKRRAYDRNNYKKAAYKYKEYKARAKRKETVFTITKEEGHKLMTEKCFYCGKQGTVDDSNGIDRWQNEEGYTLNNSVPCCWPCNRAKSVGTAEEFIELCRKVTKEWENKEY